MSYKDKTYVIFDAERDRWAYTFMVGWKPTGHTSFDFHEAQDLNTDQAEEQAVKDELRQRFAGTRQIIVLVGEATKSSKFIRWQIDTALALELPIIVVNLNGAKQMDMKLCPLVLRGKGAMHVCFRMPIIREAMDDFAMKYVTRYANTASDYRYPEDVYTDLGL